MPARALPQHAFHIADAVNWPLIEARGLLPAHALMAEAEREHAGYHAARAYRAGGVTLPSGVYIRDQRPMPPRALAGCLDPGLAPDDWYDLVNRAVFFWLDAERVARHLRAQGERPQVVVTLDAAALVTAYRQAAFVTPFNVGNARRKPATRGLRTFVPVDEWQARGWAAEAAPGARPRPGSHAPVELVVRAAIPDLAAYVQKVAPTK